MVHEDNLPQTCGSCHPGAGARFAIGPVHVVEGAGEAPIADLIRNIYLVLIPLVLGLMALHNIGDWGRKMRARLGATATTWVAARGEFRMFPAERVQHVLLAISFIVLTWTGFALKFPDEFWAYPLVIWESSWPVRGTLHRISAGVMIAVALMHVITLLASPRLRDHWRQLVPARRDIREAIGRFFYNVGLRKLSPELSTHSYVEKAEYWAVAWGTVIMTASGIILWANNFFLAWLPKAAMDIATVVHYYEAILAAAAIVVWHFYSVIFDPDVYPMNLAWLTGHAPAKPAPLPAAPVSEPGVQRLPSVPRDAEAAEPSGAQSPDSKEEPHTE
jgi:formate dehydrogenase gamma subunit